jgi:ABC-type transport system substrate-binding protein
MGGVSYGRSYDPFYGGYSGGNGGYYDPSYSSRNPYYGSGYYEPRSPWEAQRDHEQEHEKLDYKYDKAMRRLDRQEREAEEKLNRKYGGNTNDPRYQDAQRKVDQKYDHKRDKVERNTRKEHRDYHSGW